MKSVNHFERRCDHGRMFSARIVVDINTPKERTIYIPLQPYDPVTAVSAVTDALVTYGFMTFGSFVHTYCHDRRIHYNYTSEYCSKGEAIRFGTDPNFFNPKLLDL